MITEDTKNKQLVFRCDEPGCQECEIYEDCGWGDKPYLPKGWTVSWHGHKSTPHYRRPFNEWHIKCPAHG